MDADGAGLGLRGDVRIQDEGIIVIGEEADAAAAFQVYPAGRELPADPREDGLRDFIRDGYFL